MLLEIVETLTALLEEILLSWGAMGIIVIAFMENIFPPTPSEFLYPLAGKLAYDGKVDLLGVIGAGVFGSLIGAMVFYHVGYYMGAERVRAFIGRYGTLHVANWRVTLVKVSAYDAAENAFRRRGSIIVMLGRTMPFIHGIISIPAGVMRMNRLAFMFYSALGVLMWVLPTVLLGYWLGSQWQQALMVLEAYEHFWYGVLVVVVLYYARKKLLERQERRATTQLDKPSHEGNG